MLKLELPDNIVKAVAAWAECNNVDCVRFYSYSTSISFETIGCDSDNAIEFNYPNADLSPYSGRGFSLRELGIE